MPPAVLEYLRSLGKKYGSLGGKRSLETMTPAERSARAKKASMVAAAVRSARAKAKRATQPAKPKRSVEK